MNWLAHLALGGPDPVHRLGQLAGDFVQGIALDRLAPRLGLGIREHRAVDAFVDAHPAARTVRALAPPGLERFGGVVADVLFDHVLARQWARRRPGLPFAAFRARVHADLAAHRAILPERLRRIAPRMSAEDWLGSYAERDGIADVLARMEGRLRRPVPLRSAVRLLDEHGAALTAAFDRLWPDLEAFVRVRRAGAAAAGRRTTP